MEIQKVVEYLQSYDGRPLKLMEVCGTHTSSIFKNGIRSLISPKIKLISGPGCPVCVTPAAYIDKCLEYKIRTYGIYRCDTRHPVPRMCCVPVRYPGRECPGKPNFDHGRRKRLYRSDSHNNRRRLRFRNLPGVACKASTSFFQSGSR